MPKTETSKTGKQFSTGKPLPAIDALLQCTGSSQEPLEQLLEYLEDPNSFLKACERLHELADALANINSTSNLVLKKLDIPGATEPLKLMLSPAVFSPEDWGRTFAEGLMKTPEIFHGKKVVELGTGSGWISLLLLMRTGAAEILALDINPTAILIARLNCWLNGTTRDGNLVLSKYGVPIVEAVQYAVSDLLAVAITAEMRFDHVVGCIPQVLHPDESAAERTGRRASEADLYDLSNYCFQQGILEDRFGLPLIARALEESQLCLNQGGKVTLVLGGRPGPAAIESMFGRRGFNARMVWSRRIQQADDTDLASLVSLERAHGIEFHFFMSRDSQQPISAKTAVQLLAAGQPIYHDLLVYQAETRWEAPTFSFVRDLHKMKLDSLRNELDFSRITEEQVSFLRRLSSDMLHSKAIPYTHERGDLSLRRRLSDFLSFYCNYEIAPTGLFIAPEREQLISMILHMVTEPEAKILISHSLLGIYRHLCEQMELTLISGNDDLNELLSLTHKLNPRVVIIAPSQLSTPSPLNLKALQDHAERNPKRLYIVDDSAHFDISSDLNCNMNLRLASQMNLPANLILLYGLIKNTVSPDLELSFLLNAPKQWVEAFDIAAEVTYSRISYPAQLYYEWLFDELLSFPFPRETIENAPKTHSNTPVRYSPNFEKAAADKAFKAKPIDPEASEIVRMDYGEFEFPVPAAIVKGLFKGFLESNNDGLEELVAERVCAYLKATRQVCADPGSVVLGQGAFPLFGALLSSLKQKLKRAPVVALPNGSYGPIYAVIAYHGGIVENIETDPANGFLLKSGQLRKMQVKPDLLWLTQPNNPSGLFFEPNEVQAISNYCSENDILLVADEIFFLLSDRRLGAATPPYLSFGSTISSGQKNLFLFDGLSKGFAAGGMRCGFLLAPNEAWAKSIRSWVCPPPRAALRAWDALYSSFLKTSPHQFIDIQKEKQEIDSYLEDARKLLSSQRDELLALLKKHNIDDRIDTPYRGGIFLLAKLDDQAVALAKTADVLVNPGDWGRTPGWCRFCFSLKPEKFQRGMQALKVFLEA